LNYLFDADNDRQNLVQFFRRIYHALTEGGVFIFDIAEPGQIVAGNTTKGFTEGKDWIVLVEKEENQENETLIRRIITLLDTRRPFMSGDSSFTDPTCSNRIAPARVEVESPEAFGSKTQVPVCPTVLKANFRMFIAAFQSLSRTNPHPQT
jgi:hypothetical protein